MGNEFYSEIDVQVPYSPLTVTHGIATETSVADTQCYDIAEAAWIPDWTKAPLVLRPWVSIVDPDGVLESGKADMANPKWTIIENGTETEITSGTDYDVTIEAGEDCGVLAVRRNISPDTPVTLRFECDIVDSRTGDIHHVIMSKLLTCESVSSSPVLSLDVPETGRYYPVRDSEPDVTVHASFKIGNADVDASQFTLVWERKDDTGAWVENGQDVMDYDVDVAADGMSAVVHRNLMGRRLDLRVRAKYDPDGNPGAVALDVDAPTVGVTFIRKMRDTRAVILGSGRIKPGLSTVDMEAKANDGIGDIDNAEEWYAFSWYTAAGMANGSVTYTSTPVATGQKAKIPTSAITKSYGGKVRVGLKDREWLKALTVDGKVLTVGGKILLVKSI